MAASVSMYGSFWTALVLLYAAKSRVGRLHLANGLPSYVTRPGGLSGAGPFSIENKQGRVE